MICVVDNWDDDDGDEDEAAKQAALAAKRAEEEQKLQLEQLKKATGQVKDPLEGIDDGVLGQDWVRRTLEEKGHWPPKDLSFLNDEKFDYKGKMVAALDHPGLQRNIQMTMGRINSRMLNTHPELCKLCSVVEMQFSAKFRRLTSVLFRSVCGRKETA